MIFKGFNVFRFRSLRLNAERKLVFCIQKGGTGSLDDLIPFGLSSKLEEAVVVGHHAVR